MRAINPPNFNVKNVYETCINSIADVDLSKRLKNVISDII